MGEKYRKFSKLFYDSWIKHCVVDRPKLILVVDDINYYKDFDHEDFIAIELDKEKYSHLNIDKVIGTGTISRFDYSLKRYAFQACLDHGYENICFIDIDMIIRVWDWDVINNCNHSGLWCGTWYPSSGFGGEIPEKEDDVSLTNKLTALKDHLNLDFDWVNFRMPFEAALVLTAPKEKIQNFIDNWETVSKATMEMDIKKENVCHEISIAAKLSDIELDRNHDLLAVIFRHYIMNHAKLLGMYDEEYGEKKEEKTPDPTPYKIFSECPFRSPEAISHAVKDIILDKVVCELGCAEGDNMIFMSHYAKKIMGLDNQSNRYKVAKKRGLDIKKIDYRDEEIPLADVYYFWPDEGWLDNDYLIRKIISNEEFKGTIIAAGDCGHTGIRLGGPHRAESRIIVECAKNWNGELMEVPFNEGDGYRQSGKFLLAIIKTNPLLHSLVKNGFK